MNMSERHNIQIKCTDHTYGTCASCGFIAASPWSEYLREIPFEEQLEIIEMEEGPCGRVLAAPEGTPEYIGVLMKNAEMYPIDTLVSDDDIKTICFNKSLETKQKLSIVNVSYEKKHISKKKPNTKKDIRSRQKHSWKKAYRDKKCIYDNKFLIPKTHTIPKYSNRILKWCRCCTCIVKMGRYSCICRTCRRQSICIECKRNIDCVNSSLCIDCEDFIFESYGLDIDGYKDKLLRDSFYFAKRSIRKYHKCDCGYYFKSDFGQECPSCYNEYLMEEAHERRKEARKERSGRRRR